MRAFAVYGDRIFVVEVSREVYTGFGLSISRFLKGCFRRGLRF